MPLMARRDADRKRMSLFARPEKQHGNFAMTMPRGSQNLEQVKDGIKPRNIRDSWAKDAYVFADEIGEVGFVMNLQANTGAQCTLVPQEYNLKTKEWVRTTDERVLRVHSAFVGPQGGTPELIRRGFLHLGIAGEALLVGTPSEELDAEHGLHWEFLSSEELSTQRGGKTIRKMDGGSGSPLGENSYIARVYRSHPLYSGLADSPMRRVLAICRDILRLSQLVSSQIDSRLAAGIFYVPEEITFATDEDPDTLSTNVLDDEEEASAIDQFIHQLAAHLKAPVEDRSSAASLVPLLMRGPAEFFDRMGLIDIARGFDTYAQDLRKEALNRLAAGLDIDPSILEGAGRLNHWTKYAVDAEFVTKQIRPTGDLLARALTEVYLRTMLETFEGIEPTQSRKYRWVFDASTIMARTDEAASARVLHAELTLSDEALRRANGFDDADKPNDDEISYRLAVMMLQRDPVHMGPVVAAVLGLEDWDWDAIPDPAAAAPGLGGGPGGGPGGAPGNPSSPGLPPLPSQSNSAGAQEFPDATSAMQEPVNAQPGFSMLVDRLAVAGDAAVERAMEKAAARFVTKARRVEGLKQKVEPYKGPTVLSVVGPTDLLAAACPVEDLLKEAWDGYGMSARRWIRKHLEMNGVTPMRADDMAAIASSQLCQRMQTFTEQNLHDTLPMQSNNTRIANHLVVEALKSAGVT